jgi:hypothetical protein
LSRDKPGKQPSRSRTAVKPEPDRAERVAIVTTAPTSARWWKFASGASLIALALAAGALLSFHLIYEPDLGWHLAQGREIAAGRLVRTNLFSGTYPDYPQPFESWLFELGAFSLWRIGGDAGLQAGQTLLLALTLAVVYFACRRRATIAAVLAIEAFGLFVIEPRAVPRPHLASFVLMAGCALLVERVRELRSAIPLAWAALLIALWGNLHAECLFGTAFIGMFAVAEFLRPQTLSKRQAWIALGLAAVCTAANAANPFGKGLVEYLWENARAPVQIAEFRPAYLPTYAPFFVYLLCGAGLMLWKRRTLALWEMSVFVAFAVLALRHVRFAPLFFCVTAPMVAARLADLFGNGNFGKIKAPTLAAGAALTAGMLISPVPLTVRFEQLGVGSNFLEIPEMFSPEAVAFIRSAGLQGAVFNSNNLGGYLIWNLYPQVRVFQDSRFQSYPPQHFANIIGAYQSQSEWDKLVAGVDWAVLTLQRSTPLTGAGRFPPEQWAPVYRDNAVVIVVRRSGRFGALAAGPQ